MKQHSAILMMFLLAVATAGFFGCGDREAAPASTTVREQPAATTDGIAADTGTAGNEDERIVAPPGMDQVLRETDHLILLAPETVLRVGAIRNQYTLEQGNILVSVRGPVDQFTVHAGSASIGVRGTDFSVTYRGGGGTVMIAAFSGEITLTVADDTRNVAPQTVALVSRAGDVQLDGELSAEDRKDWEKLRALPEYAELYGRSAAVTPATVAPEFTIRFLQSPSGPVQHVDFGFYPPGVTVRDEQQCVGYSNGAEREVTLEPGTYDIWYKWGPVEGWDRGLVVAPDGAEKHDIILNCGTLDLSFVQAVGGPSQHVDFAFTEPDQPEKVIYEANGDRAVVLPAGTYDLHYFWKNIDGWELGITVTAGQTQALTVITGPNE